MIKNNIFTKYIKKIKYIKNDFIIKCNIIKNKKRKGEKVSIKDILIEFKIIKNKKQTKNISNVNSLKNKENSNLNKPKNDKENLKNLLYSISLILISYSLSLLMFYKGTEIQFFKLTEDNEYKILNILESPKTETYINPFYDIKHNSVKYTITIVDNLDTYSYRIKLDSTSEELKEELLLNNYKNTSEIQTLKDVNPSSIVKYNDKYLIDNKYNIDAEKVNDSTLNYINNNIKEQSATNFNNAKFSLISLITVALSLIFNGLYFLIRKVISKK